MKPMYARRDSHLGFLEPPHSHNPSSVSNIAGLPPTTVQKFPTNVQSALFDLQQSTSIAFASYTRLKELLSERFDRLVPTVDTDGEVTFSESSFFNFTNALSAERSYFLYDALPDWRHKASSSYVALQPYQQSCVNSPPNYPGASKTISDWYSHLQIAVESWSEHARAVVVPEFEDTVDEYLTFQRRNKLFSVDLENSPIETPDIIPTPRMEDDPGQIQLSTLNDEDFDVVNVSVSFPGGEDTLIRLPSSMGTNRVSRISMQEFLLKDDGKIRDERKDSGIDLID